MPHITPSRLGAPYFCRCCGASFLPAEIGRPSGKGKAQPLHSFSLSKAKKWIPQWFGWLAPFSQPSGRLTPELPLGTEKPPLVTRLAQSHVALTNVGTFVQYQPAITADGFTEPHGTSSTRTNSRERHFLPAWCTSSGRLQTRTYGPSYPTAAMVGAR